MATTSMERMLLQLLLSDIRNTIADGYTEMAIAKLDAAVEQLKGADTVKEGE